MGNPKIGDLRVWHIPQIPGKPFWVSVETPAIAKQLLNVLAEYDLFQYRNNIKGDYANAQGLEIFMGDFAHDGSGWYEWHDAETGDNIDEWEPSC